jgi:hypothetical protein
MPQTEEDLTAVRHRYQQELRAALLPNENLADVLKWKSDLTMISKLREEHLRLQFAESATYKRASGFLKELALKNELPSREQVIKVFELGGWTVDAWESASEVQCYQRRNQLLAGMKPASSIKSWSYEDILEVRQSQQFCFLPWSHFVSAGSGWMRVRLLKPKLVLRTAWHLRAAHASECSSQAHSFSCYLSSHRRLVNVVARI